jgi:hypothetical protein
MVPLAELLTHARASDADADLIVAYEAAAVQHVQRLTGRYFGPPAERTEYVAGEGQRELILVNDIAPEGTVAVVMDGTAVPAEDFEIRGRRLRHVSGWGHPGYAAADLVVTYTAGYAVTQPADDYDDPIADVAAPDDVRQAVRLLVAHWYEFRIPVALGTVAPEVAAGLRDLLAPWVRHSA